jgi:rod shape-determining protein MreD
MINLVLSVLSLFLIFLQLTYPSSLTLFSVRPDFLLIIVIFLSLYSKGLRSFFWAVLLGGLKDLVSFDLFGLNLLSYSLISIGLKYLEVRFFLKERTSTLFLFVLCVCFINLFLNNMLHVILAGRQYFLLPVLRIFFLGSLLTAIWSIPVIYILKKCASEFFTV